MSIETKNHDVAALAGYLSDSTLVDYVKKARVYEEGIVVRAIGAVSDGVNYPANEYDKKYGYFKGEVGDVVSVISAVDYVEYLKSLGGKERGVIQYMEQKFNNYDRIKDQVKILLSEINCLEDPSEHCAHICQNVFDISVDGKPCVLRWRPHSGSVVSYLIGTSFIEGEPHFEQIMAASVEDHVTIAEKIPGVRISDMTPEEIESISDEHINQCFDSLLNAWVNDLPMENKGKNILYSKDAGFGFIDFVYNFSLLKAGREKELYEYFWPVFLILVTRGKMLWTPKTKEVMEENLLNSKRSLLMLERVSSIILEKTTDLKIVTQMEEYRHSYERNIRVYSDPILAEQELIKNNQRIVVF